MVSFSETTTPGSAGENKKNYIVKRPPWYHGSAVGQLHQQNTRRSFQKDIASLQHTTWRCQYHVVFAPKYRRMVIYGQILRKLCEQKGVEIIQAEACPDHIHMLISIPSKYSVSQIMGYLKGKSSLLIFDRYANLKYQYGDRHFWARGYYVDTVGRNKK